jgi:hypothetical protein
MTLKCGLYKKYHYYGFMGEYIRSTILMNVSSMNPKSDGRFHNSLRRKEEVLYENNLSMIFSVKLPQNCWR